MKLVVIIPTYNEEKTIKEVIGDIPRNISGVEVEILVIDDGSTDKTLEEVKGTGADYVISSEVNRGLGYSFQKGINEALKRGADIIVNIDADHQYNSAEIPKLIRPILENKADMVIGDRQVKELTHMPFVKKYGNLIVSRTIGLILDYKVSDVSSGFRAFSRECALRISITSDYTYTLENIIQAYFQRVRIKEVPIEFKKRKFGNSRLIRSLFKHILFCVLVVWKTHFKYSFNSFFQSRKV